ncbi:MAG: hypothetical protein EHM20_14150 [Alphaproteobacteria bacterium]|nr:MAG: hypothetical protein EHM20_14150 [Alphaproteobacteria bacterium]
MRISEKVNFKKYAIYSAIILSLGIFLSRTAEEVWVMIVVFAAACGNQWLLVKSVGEMTEKAATGAAANGFKLSVMSIGKFALIVAALSFGGHIMGNRIIIPLLIYILQIAVLYLSFK